MGFALATAAIGGSSFMGAAGAIEEGQAESNAANYNATLAGFNATQAEQNAKLSTEAGSARAAMQGRQTRAEFGSERANAAGGGLDPNSGSAVDVQASTAELGHLDALTIRTNAAKEAYGYQTQSTDFQNQAKLDVMSGEQAKIASQYKATSSLLGGASDASSKYQEFKMAGAL